MKISTIIYLVRHGQSEASISGVYGTDSVLTEKGLSQARDASDRFLGVHLDEVYTSALTRAQQTAGIIAETHGLSVRTNADLREPFYGKLEGQNRKLAREEYADKFRQREGLTDDQRMNFKIVDDMESDAEALGRFAKALEGIAKENIGKTVLVISHVPIMKLLLIHLGYTTRSQLDGESVDNGGTIKLGYENGKFEVLQTTGVHKIC
jgi:broad specificity phosphatase PhoE